jgi:hypothetical protein
MVTATLDKDARIYSTSSKRHRTTACLVCVKCFAKQQLLVDFEGCGPTTARTLLKRAGCALSGKMTVSFLVNKSTKCSFQCCCLTASSASGASAGTAASGAAAFAALVVN